MKNFYEKLQDIERVVNFVLECLSEWQVFQRHWIYLEEIFSLPEIQKQLEAQCRRFIGIDTQFKAITRGFELAIKVHVGVYRELTP
jgi:dynein heavy chain